MRVGYVVLYVKDSDACLEFWTKKVGMVLKGTTDVAGHALHKVGFADQDFSFELVPLALMKDNPDNLDLATPSIAFYVPDLNSTHEKLRANGVITSEIAEHSGKKSFAFSDNENRWFAVLVHA
jgi:lactoylglutathione lyase